MALFSQNTKVQALKRAPLFADLSKKELQQLARVSEDLEVDAGTVLCREGEIGNEFFVIVDGDVKITRKGRRVAQRSGGEFIGEIALLEDVPRTATVTAETPLRMFVLTSVNFMHLVHESPKVEHKVMRALARRLAEISSDPQIA